MSGLVLPLLIFSLMGMPNNDITPDGNYRINTLPALGKGTGEYYLQYDDGSPCWLTWEGTFRGVWFNTDDFLPLLCIDYIEFTEFWMYHDSSYPWDISEFYAEVWSCNDGGWPIEQLAQLQVTAVHYAPVFAYHNKHIGHRHEFWVINNSSLSVGGWPSLLGEGSPPLIADHSFYSDDFSIWTPWSDGTTTGDYLIRAEVSYLYPALQRVTWGSLKVVF